QGRVVGPHEHILRGGRRTRCRVVAGLLPSPLRQAAGATPRRVPGPRAGVREPRFGRGCPPSVPRQHPNAPWGTPAALPGTAGELPAGGALPPCTARRGWQGGAERLGLSCGAPFL